ncbi:MAG: hypothetical protein HYY31_04440 [Chloroflexi bacterium]|nr:hypothetical protein [Chloroflexota bacterium]
MIALVLRQKTTPSLWAIAVGLLVAILSVAFLSVGCLIPVERGKEVRGRNMILRVTQIRFVDEVPYYHLGKHYVIRPTENGNTLAVARVTINNHRSAELSMYADLKVAKVEDSQNLPYGVLDPFERGIEVEQPLKDEGLYQPFIWGTISLGQGYEITGWMVFEVPKGTQVARFVWEQGEYIVVRFTGPGS